MVSLDVPDDIGRCLRRERLVVPGEEVTNPRRWGIAVMLSTVWLRVDSMNDLSCESTTAVTIRRSTLRRLRKRLQGLDSPVQLLAGGVAGPIRHRLEKTQLALP